MYLNLNVRQFWAETANLPEIDSDVYSVSGTGGSEKIRVFPAGVEPMTFWLLVHRFALPLSYRRLVEAKARNCFSSTSKYIVMQMSKGDCSLRENWGGAHHQCYTRPSFRAAKKRKMPRNGRKTYGNACYTG